MSNAIFVTATDTDAGKTLVSRAILELAKDHGLSTLGYKPVSAGCELTPEGLRNEDALFLQQASTIDCPYEKVNPIAYADPVAPHLAAARVNQVITVEQLSSGMFDLQQYRPDLLLVEGAGGWRLPLGKGSFLSDFVIQHKMPVIFVIGLKLGCLNHALLTYEALKSDGINVVGWVANLVDPEMRYLEQNITSLKDMIDAPCIGVIPFLDNTEDAKQFLHIDLLLNS